MLQLRTLLLPPLLLLVSEKSSQDLPAGTLGNHIYKLDTAFQPLVPTLRILDMLRDITRNHFVILLQADGR